MSTPLDFVVSSVERWGARWGEGKANHPPCPSHQGREYLVAGGLI